MNKRFIFAAGTGLCLVFAAVGQSPDPQKFFGIPLAPATPSPGPPPATPVPGGLQVLPGDLVIEAFVDGPSRLRFSTAGIQWKNGNNAKPGRHDGKREPTYIGSKPWIPQWNKNEKDRGEDLSDIYPMPLTGLEVFTADVINVSKTRGETGTEKRKLEVYVESGEFNVRIPDPQPGARWYTLVIHRPDNPFTRLKSTPAPAVK